MANPYVTWTPAEVGPCTATWLVGIDSGNAENSFPVFGPATPTHETGAWDYLVDGPLKDVLTGTYENKDAALIAWAKAGGSVDFTAQTNNTAVAVFGAGAALGPVFPSLPGPMAWLFMYDSTVYPSLSFPLRWVVKFSVPHSIIR